VALLLLVMAEVSEHRIAVAVFVRSQPVELIEAHHRGVFVV
jgi:hypothetical protein